MSLHSCTKYIPKLSCAVTASTRLDFEQMAVPKEVLIDSRISNIGFQSLLGPSPTYKTNMVRNHRVDTTNKVITLLCIICRLVPNGRPISSHHRWGRALTSLVICELLQPIDHEWESIRKNQGTLFWDPSLWLYDSVRAGLWISSLKKKTVRACSFPVKGMKAIWTWGAMTDTEVIWSKWSMNEKGEMGWWDEHS